MRTKHAGKTRVGLWGQSVKSGMSHLDDRKSTSGYVFMLCSGVVLQSSKKQAIVSLSTTKAKFVAATTCTYQAVWMKKILGKLNFTRQGHITIFCDNNSTSKLSKNPVLHGRSKHIDVKFHFLIPLSWYRL